MIGVGIATALFAALHSALAAKRIGRVAYNAQAVVTFGALVAYIGSRPKRTIYRIRGPLAGLMRLGQLAGVAFGAAAAHATGIATLAGLDDRDPAAQGPEADDEGQLRIRGPFRLVRHPLNLAPLAPFWLTPHMTTRRLAFNAVATAYLVLGSLHEERRLLRKYGAAYEAYRRSGVPFYLPWKVRCAGSDTAAHTGHLPGRTYDSSRPHSGQR